MSAGQFNRRVPSPKQTSRPVPVASPVPSSTPASFSQRSPPSRIRQAPQVSRLSRPGYRAPQPSAPRQVQTHQQMSSNPSSQIPTAPRNVINSQPTPQRANFQSPTTPKRAHQTGPSTPQRPTAPRTVSATQQPATPPASFRQRPSSSTIYRPAHRPWNPFLGKNKLKVIARSIC